MFDSEIKVQLLKEQKKVKFPGNRNMSSNMIATADEGG